MTPHSSMPLFRPELPAARERVMQAAKLFLAALAVSCATQAASSNRGPSANWSTAKAVPDRLSQQRNILHLDGNRLLWNGDQISETAGREFLGVTATMNPQPLLVLTYSARTPRERVQRARSLVDEVVGCNLRKCLEVSDSSQ